MPTLANLMGRVVFAALGAYIAHALTATEDHPGSAPWILALGVLGFQLGKWLTPLALSVLQQLDPPRNDASPDRSSRH